MLTDGQIHRLIDIANAACHKGLVADARTIYTGILTIRPKHIPALIGQALSHIVVDEFDTAETLLKTQILEEHPEDADARAMLGLCLVLASRTDEARELLEPLSAESSSAAELASGLLDVIRSRALSS